MSAATLAEYLMQHGVLKHADAERMAKEIEEMLHESVNGHYWKKRAEKAEAACAEMRKEAYEAKRVLAYVAYQRLPLGNTVFDTLPEHWQREVTTALDMLSTDCGKGVMERVSKLREALEMCINAIKDEDWNKMGKAVRAGEKLLNEATKL